MRKPSAILVALLMSLGLGTFAATTYARGGGGGDCGPLDGGRNHAERRVEHMQQRQQQLHDSLKLSAEQEAGWKKYAESMTPPAREDMGPGRNDANSKLTAPERAEKMLEFSKKFQDRMATQVAALKTFYATLTPEQQKTFDEFHSGPRGPRGDRRGPPKDKAAAPPASK